MAGTGRVKVDVDKLLSLAEGLFADDNLMLLAVVVEVVEGRLVVVIVFLGFWVELVFAFSLLLVLDLLLRLWCESFVILGL